MIVVINLKLLFENTTKYTKTTYDTFLAFHSKKYHFSYTLYTALIVAFILFALVMQIKYHNYTLAFIFCFGMTFFILWRFFRPISDISKEYKSEKIKKEKEFTFKFYDNFFMVEDDKQFSKLKYYQLHKVFETNDFFYLYLDKNHSFLLNKDGFKKKNSSAFSTFIKKKCWWCFKTHKK